MESKSTPSTGLANEDGYPAARYAWFVVICLQLAYAIAIVDRQVLALLVQSIRADLKISDTEFSLVAGAAFVACYSTLGLAFGRVADRYNRRDMIVFGMLVWCCATVACGLVGSFWGLFIARMFVGAGEAALNPAAYSMIGDYFSKEKRSRAASAYTMAIFTGAGGGLVVAAIALAATEKAGGITLPIVGAVKNWQAVFILAGLPGLLLAAVIRFFIREPTRREMSVPEGETALMKRFLARKGPVLLLIIAAFALNGLVYSGVGIWTPAIYIRKFGWSPSQIGTALGVIQMTFGTVGILVGGWWLGRPAALWDQRSLFRVTRNAMLSMPVLVSVAGMSTSPALAIVATALLVFAGGVVSGQSAVALFLVTPNLFRGQVVASYILTGTLMGLGIGVTLIAAVTDHVFHDDKLVGASLACVVTVASLAAARCLHKASTSSELNLAW